MQRRAGRIFRSEMKEQSITTRSARRERLRETGRREVAGVGFLHDDHARVAAEFPGELAVADVHGIDLCRRRPAAGNR